MASGMIWHIYYCSIVCGSMSCVADDEKFRADPTMRHLPNGERPDFFAAPARDSIMFQEEAITGGLQSVRLQLMFYVMGMSCSATLHEYF